MPLPMSVLGQRTDVSSNTPRTAPKTPLAPPPPSDGHIETALKISITPQRGSPDPIPGSYKHNSFVPPSVRGERDTDMNSIKDHSPPAHKRHPSASKGTSMRALRRAAERKTVTGAKPKKKEKGGPHGKEVKTR